MRASAIALVILVGCAPAPRNGNGGGGDDDTNTGADAGSGQTGSNQGSNGSNGNGSDVVYVYAHTATTLYRVDPDSLAISEVGDFGWPNGDDQMTDIAIDKNGQMVGISFGSVYKVDSGNAKATLMSSSLQGDFNGLSYVPASLVNGGSGDDVLVGTRNDDGAVFEIDPNTGATTQIGNMGGGFMSSGDIVAVDGLGILQTVPGNGGDMLTTLASGSFSATVVGSTQYDQIWGLAFWKNKVFGFTNGGAFVTIDPHTGATTMVSNNGEAWWGAAVTTKALVIQ
jgi:hypothetical protein